MRTLVSAVGMAAFALVGCNNDFSRTGRASSGDDLVLRAHFVGSEQLLKDKNASKLVEVWNLRTSVNLRNDALDKFSRLPAAWMGNALPRGSSEQTNLFRALLDDALVNESFIEWRASGFTLAAKLPEARAKVWDTNLRQIATNWKLGNPATFPVSENNGWQIARAGAPSVRFVRAGEWTAVTVGQGAAVIESNVLGRLKQFAKPGGAWLEGEANLAQWKGRAPLLEHFNNLPLANFSLSNRADSVRTFVQFNFPKPHGWKSEPWQIPTNYIWDPLVDFTVVRGISGVLESIPFVRNLGLDPVPSQICGWGNDDLPYQFFYAMPSRDVAGQLKRMGPKMPGELARLSPNLTGEVATGSNSLVWRGLPVTPVLGPMKDGQNEYMFLQLVPVTRMKVRPPAELYAQFAGRNDVVLYDWESTERRLPHIRQGYQLTEIGTRRTLPRTNALDIAWQLDIASHLSDTVTELRSTSPSQMTLVRKSTLGFTAFELATLSRWLQSTDFPAFGVHATQPGKTPPRKPAAKQGR